MKSLDVLMSELKQHNNAADEIFERIYQLKIELKILEYDFGVKERDISKIKHDISLLLKSKM